MFDIKVKCRCTVTLNCPPRIPKSRPWVMRPRFCGLVICSDCTFAMGSTSSRIERTAIAVDAYRLQMQLQHPIYNAQMYIIRQIHKDCIDRCHEYIDIFHIITAIFKARLLRERISKIFRFKWHDADTYTSLVHNRCEDNLTSIML